jgi:hypothetical protein
MEIEIKESEIKDMKEKATEVKSCKKCTSGLSKTQKWMLVLSAYIFASSLYGTYKLIETLTHLF